MTTQQRQRLCSLEAAVGKSEACPQDACPFWELGGAVPSGRCAFEQLDITGDASLAAWLLEIRGRLEDANAVDEEQAMHAAFHRLLNDSAE